MPAWETASFENEAAGEWFLAVEQAIDPGSVIAETLDAALLRPTSSSRTELVNRRRWRHEAPVGAEGHLARSTLWGMSRPGCSAGLRPPQARGPGAIQRAVGVPRP